jgi:L,D-transpeptidase YcbB
MPFEGRRTRRICLLAALAIAPWPAGMAVAQVGTPASSTPTVPSAAATEASSQPAAETNTAPGAPGLAGTVPAPATGVTPSGQPQTPDVAGTPPATFTLDIADALKRVPASAMGGRNDRAAVAAVYEARNGSPIWMTPRGPRPEALKLTAEIAKADDWGLKASDFDLPNLDASVPDGASLPAAALADTEARLSLAALRYARLARGGRVEPTALTDFLDRKAPVFDPRSVLEQIATAAEPDQYLRQLHPQHAEFERLRQRYLVARDLTDRPKGGGPTEAERLLANMEQWRWMPSDLGAFHIWVNIPEQLVRVVRNNEVIHTERVIIGKLDSQTPVFSDEMEQVIFNPLWGVPDSIKTNEILPGLRRGGAILAKQNLRIQLRGKDINPATIDWSRTDIRNFHVFQPPGSGNVLGVVKFWLPNKHAVYLHDTPSKNLFKSAARTFSHGCVRVQDPIRLAEVILAEDRGMSADRVRALAAKGSPENNAINLSRRIPVHMTYFTMRAEPSGQVASFKDVYGHEERIRLGLEGKMHLVKAVPRPATPAGPIGRLVEASPSYTGFAGFSGFSGGGSVSTTRPDWARGAFSGGD